MQLVVLQKDRDPATSTGNKHNRHMRMKSETQRSGYKHGQPAQQTHKEEIKMVQTEGSKKRKVKTKMKCLKGSRFPT